MNHPSSFRRSVLATALLCLAAPAPSALLNIPVAARVISFVQPTPVGVVPVAIVYQPGNAASESEASDMERALSGGMRLGRATFRTRRVAVSNLGQLSGTKAAFVTTGLRSHQDELSAATSGQSIVTITADSGCVVSGHCVVGISNANKTQIIVNKAAARRNGVHFGSAFLMLVKEI